MASTSLSRTQTGTVTNNKIATFSFWIKRSGLSSYQDPVSAVSGGDYAQIQFTNTDTLSIYQRDSSSTTMQVVTSRKFRDVNAWYHIVIALDTTQATASNRVKIYVNGVQETSFDTTTYPAQNLVLRINTASHSQYVGAYSTSSNYVNGLFAHFHQIDGTAYDASYFGESDANGVWTPITSPSVTYGTNGFFLKFENSGSMGTDSSGNANNFTVNGTLTQTLDTPSNVYATWNPLHRNRTVYGGLGPGQCTFSNGNTTVTGPSGSSGAGYSHALSTLAIEYKTYAEFKIINTSGNSVGIAPITYDGGTYGDLDVAGPRYGSNGSIYVNGSSQYSGTAMSTNDIIGIAVDSANQKAWFSHNGTWQGSGTQDPATNTGGYDYSYVGNVLMTYAFGDGDSAGAPSTSANFGNGYFGTTAVSSAGSNGNGSIFEYDVPTGYYALNTKNLATYG